MARIYVSSTHSDLADYRKEVSLALRRLGHQDVAMEYYGAEHRRPLDRCLDDVTSCDAYIGIFAWRYGYIPTAGNPDRRSITDLEYRRAIASGRKCLIFLVSEDAPWPPKKMELPAMGRVQALRDELRNCGRHVVDVFGTPDELARKVTEAVTKWEKETGSAVGRESADWHSYREAVSDRHRWVRLQVIAGASKEREPLRIPLTEVFEPQLVAPGISGTDVPDEVREYQREIYGARPRVPEATDSAEDKENQEETEHEEGNGDIPAEGDDRFFPGNPEHVLDVLGRERAQVILGGPGAGKSTLLQYAMLRVCEPADGLTAAPRHLKNEPIPFLVELRNYVLLKDPHFVSYMAKRASNFYGTPIDAGSIDRVLDETDRAIVFFDGLDEIFDPDERRRVIEQFQAFASRYPGARVVVTSRIAGYDRAGLGLARFEHYTLTPLPLSHIRNFAERWYRHYTLEGTERTAQGLVQRIVESPRLLDLAGNPLLLTMMAVIYKDRDLPNERWRLYERCAETLLEDWDLSKGIEDEDFKLAVSIRTAQKSDILQRVSMYMLEHSQAGSELNAIAYAPLHGIVASYLTEKYQRSRGEAEAITVDILRHLMERTYVLAGIGERVFGFVHRTFMEYFAACRCLTQFNALKSDFSWLTRDVFESHWRLPEWQEVLLLLVAMLHDQGTPVGDVVEHLRQIKGVSPPFNIAFAARCLGEVGNVQDQAQGQQLQAELAEAIAEYASRSRRQDAQPFVESALASFAALAPTVETAPMSVHKAITYLNEIDTVATKTAAWQMGFALRSRKERLNYAISALSDSQEAVRRGAIAALEREWPGRADIGPLLARVVEDDRYSRVRLAALGSIQRSWRYEPAILTVIGARVGKETAQTVVIRFIEYLAAAWSGNRKAFRLVTTLVSVPPYGSGNYSQADVFAAAVQAIAHGWSGDDQALTFLRNQAIGDHEQAIRVIAVQAIAQGWGNDQALAVLRDPAIRDAEQATRTAALRAIAQFCPGDAQAVTFLRNRATDDSEPGIRTAALQAIVQLWPSDAQTLVFLRDRAINDPEQAIRATVLRVIAEHRPGAPETATFFQDRAVNDPEPAVRATTLRAIAQHGPGHAQALAFLRDRATNDPEQAVRAITLRAIAQHGAGNARALAFFQDRAVNDPEPGVRATSLRAIAERWSGDARALVFLQDRVINGQELHTRTAALLAVAQHWSSDVQSGLFVRSQAVTAPEPAIRTAALHAVAQGWTGRGGLAFVRDRAADDPDPAVRAAALKIYVQGRERYGRMSAGDVHVGLFLRNRAADDPDPAVRETALRAIAKHGSGDAQAATFLRKQAVNDPDPAARTTAPHVVKPRSGDDQDLAFLRDRAADDPDPAIRATTLRAIAQDRSGDAQAATFLRKQAINDPDPGVRAALLQAIAQYWSGDAQAATFLRKQAINDPDPGVRAAPLEAIAQYWSPTGALAFLRSRAVSDPEPAVRTAALEAIAQRWANDARVGAFLESRVRGDPDPGVRTAASQAIAQPRPGEGTSGPGLERSTP